jgi:single-stranded-DNA-specific exonuclease
MKYQIRRIELMLPRLTKNWELRERIPSEIDLALSKYPVFFRQILYSRGVQNEQQAEAYLGGVVENDDPFQLLQMEETVTRLLYAVDNREPIAVYGDYDVDGVTATALLTLVLRRYGAEVFPYIPNRFDEGYGLNVEALESLLQQGVRVVITVDCGIRSPEEVRQAEGMGLDLIITDHHHPSEVLPDAWSVVCPKRPGDQYPDKDLSGVGLAYKIAQALSIRRPEAGVRPEEWLDLVALGTVADMVPLRGENRALVRRGLSRIRGGMRPVLLSLANVAGLKNGKVTAGDIGFVLGPRLNAAGRLENARDALTLLMSEDIMECGKLAQQLDNQNRQRQGLTRQIQDDAENMAHEVGTKDILFAFSTSFNSGVVGLAASRLVDKYYRPAVVGEVGPEFTRASCRSIPEFHITAALDACQDLLVRHGGHALAAGFTVRNENLPALIDRLRALAEQELNGQELSPVLHADFEIPLCELRPDFLHYLEQLQPTGQNNSEAVFISRNLRVVKSNPVGTEKQHLRLTVSDGQITYDAIAFRLGHQAATLPQRIDLMYVYERNEYNGRVNMQLNVRDLRIAETAEE